MVSCEPFQSYKVPLKNCGQSVIEHNLVTVYLSLEWADNTSDNPNLILHIFDKKTSPKPCKSEASMSFFQQNQSSLPVNSIHHHQQQNFGSSSSYQQQYHHHYHHSSVINNEPTTTTITTGDHNDVSSTTTTVVFSGLQPQPPPSQPLTSHTPIQQLKSESKTQLSPIYRRQPTPNSPICSSTNQPYLSSQHVIQTPSSNMDTQSTIQMSPTLKTISPTSSTNLPTKQTLSLMIDLQQSPSISSYPIPTSSPSSTFKAFACSCLKPHVVHEHNCPAMTLIKQPSNNTTLTSQAVLCRPPSNRTLAQRAAVASQIRTNRTVSMTPMKEQGQTSSSTTTTTPLLPFAISNIKASDLTPNVTTIVSQQQQEPFLDNNYLQQPNYETKKAPIVRQRSIGSTNSRQRKKRIIKQISLPTGTNQDQSSFYNQINLNDSKQQSMYMIKEEQHTSSHNTMAKSPVKLISPFSINSIPTTVSNSEIDQTIDDVINGKGDILINDPPQVQVQQPQPQPQPSSQLVWVQNGTVTTKTWLSPLYQKQQQQPPQQQQPAYDPNELTLTHQDVVNIAQQVVFPTISDQNKMNTVLQPPITNNSKKRNRSKSTTNTAPKRNRNRKVTLNKSQSTTAASIQQANCGQTTITSPITPTLNLINKPIPWSNIPTPPSSSSRCVTMKTNPPILNSNLHLSSSFDKNDSWETQCVENVDAMLDEFQLVSIDEQRMHGHNQFDFDLSTDGFSSKANDRFGSSTPPPPLTMDNQRFALSSTDKYPNQLTTNSKLGVGDVDVYEHFLNPLPLQSSSSVWQENQVTSSVSTPPDMHMNHFPFPQQQPQQQQQYYPSQIKDESFDSYNLQSQVRLLSDVQS